MPIESERTTRLDAISRCRRALLNRFGGSAAGCETTSRPSGSVEVEEMALSFEAQPGKSGPHGKPGAGLGGLTSLQADTFHLKP